MIGETVNEFLYAQYRANLHRNQHIKRKDRQLHKLERALYFWPMWAWVYMRGRRLKPEQTIKAPEGAFFNTQNQEE